MRNLLAFLAAVVLTVACVGWYLGWYTVENTPAPQGHNAVQIDIDRHKIGDDLHKGGQKLQEAIDKNRSKEDEKKENGIKRAEAIPQPTKPQSN
jgi:hypothetical protein